MNTYKRLNASTEGLFTNLVKPAVRPKYKKYYATNMHGIVELVSAVEKGRVTVRFLDTGSEKEVEIGNLTKGKCKDDTRPSIHKVTTEFEDKIYKSKSSGEFTILSRKGKYCTVRFVQTGTTVDCLIANASKGKVWDYMKPSVYAKGYMGKFDYDASIIHKYEYTLWHNMLKRIYCEADKRGYFGKGVTVSDSWLSFANFMQDVKSLNNYKEWYDGVSGKSLIKYNLDKDFAYLDCLHYSKETCQFIDESLNKGTTRNTIARKIRIDKYNQQGVQ
jgi:hypothetical protein